MKVTLINPNIVSQRGDLFGTGIPYMPIILAYTAAFLRKKKHEVTVIDSFGLDPFKKRAKDNFIIQGLDIAEVIDKIPDDTQYICIYAGQAVSHFINLQLIKEIKKRKKVPIIVIENSQAVTAYSLRRTAPEFFKAGAKYLVLGDPEYKLNKIIECKKPQHIQGIIYKKQNQIKINKDPTPIKNLDELPFPAWDLFPIENYWKLKYAHAPFSGNYLPLLTSRGCPYSCEFCIIPGMNMQKWRPRSAKNVVDEIQHHKKTFGISDFPIEDLNPTIDKNRIQDICKEILKRRLKITFKFAAGTKAETIDEATLNLLKQAGCTYISISPESGSKHVLKLMKKPYDHEHGLKIVKKANKLGIISQACFVLGFPGETRQDLKHTRNYIKELTKAGIDEIALFIMTPIPGSAAFEHFKGKFKNIAELTFSPKWREDYKTLNRFRFKMYIQYALWKLIYHPTKLFKHPIHILTKNFKVKGEMTIYRVLKTMI